MKDNIEMAKLPEINEGVERAYTLRRLKDEDLWPILNIISTVFPL